MYKDHPCVFIFLVLGAMVILPQSTHGQGDRSSTSAPAIEHVPAWTHSFIDEGVVPGSIWIEHLKLMVTRDSGREEAFQQVLRDLYDPKSRRYHQWLAPHEIGEQFGADQKTLDEVSAWLSSRGLTVNGISKSRVVIDFAGKVSALSSAFSTEFHYFDAGGEKLISLTTDPVFDPSIASKVKYIAGFSSVPVHPGTGIANVTPDLNCATGCTHVVSPADFAVIYNLGPVYNSGNTGQGQTVAIVGLSRVNNSDIEAFQQKAGLPITDPIVRIPVTGTDPGPPNLSGDLTYLKEATLDVERVFGTAPGASVILDVTTPNPSGVVSTNPLNFPITDIIDNNVAPIMTMSFAGCEANVGMPEVFFEDSMFQQASAEGISVFVSSGDSGVDTCANHFDPPPSTGSANINYLCASGYVTCVGGTQFNDTADPSQYWAASNSGHLLSALGYIPEGAWNQSTTTILNATGGGTSLWIPQPAWQTGVGVPAGGNRTIPDVAFNASSHDGYYGCLAELDGSGDCAQNKLLTFFGTSAATPSMAGIMALVNQTLAERQGNFNPTLYSLAATPSNGVFNDITVASSGVSDCDVDTPSLCNNSITLKAGSSPPVLPGFLVGPGYDLATGWGSINVGNLITALTSQSVPAPSTTTLSASLTSVSTTQGNTLTVAVFGAAGTPSGTVQILMNGNTYGTALPLQSGELMVQMPETRENVDESHEPKPERSRLVQLLEEEARKQSLEKALKSNKTA
jgi:subtilase family serine protease